ncbi:MAG: hypothetical protein GX444_01950 [Myxococcales bacterium]|nr:hypothetical protein [Myxococcales bacterium]
MAEREAPTGKAIRRLTVLLLLALGLGSTAVLATWHWRNLIPVGYDSNLHYHFTAEVARNLAAHPARLWSLFAAHPARYLPLPYFVGAISWLWAGGAYWSLAAPLLFFWLLACAALAGAGWLAAPGRLAATLPLAAFLATPVAWKAGQSFNLEIAVTAAAATLLFFFLLAERKIHWVAWFAVVLISATLAQTKLVLLLAVAPAGAVWCFTGEPAVRWRRALMWSAVCLSAGAWAYWHREGLAAEFLTDFRNTTGEPLFGAFFYFRELATDLRGGLLLVFLTAFLIERGMHRRLRRADAAFAAFFLVPLLAFTAVDTKRGWYLLGPYLALPAWAACIAGTTDESRRLRLASSFVAAVTLLFVGVQTGLATVAALGEPSGHHLGGILRPMPFPGLDRATVRRMVSEGQQGLLTGDPAKTAALHRLFLLAAPRDDNARVHLAEDFYQAGQPAAALAEWETVLRHGTIGSQLWALHGVATAEAAGAVPAGTFEGFLTPLLETHTAERVVRYSLLLEQVYFYQAKRDWPAVFATLDPLRAITLPDEVTGIDLAEAEALANTDRVAEAVALLRRVLERTAAGGTQEALVRLGLARNLVLLRQFDEAERQLERAEQGRYDDGQLADVAGRMLAAARPVKGAAWAEDFLAGRIARLRGEARASLLVELGRLQVEQNRRDLACRSFREALALLEDPRQAEWVRRTLAETAECRLE